MTDQDDAAETESDEVMTPLEEDELQIPSADVEYVTEGETSFGVQLRASHTWFELVHHPAKVESHADAQWQVYARGGEAAIREGLRLAREEAENGTEWFKDQVFEMATATDTWHIVSLCHCGDEKPYSETFCIQCDAFCEVGEPCDKPEGVEVQSGWYCVECRRYFTLDEGAAHKVESLHKTVALFPSSPPLA